MEWPVEVGVSGSYGAQDRTPSNDHAMWFVGPDLLAQFGRVDAKAQWLKGGAAGDAAAGAYKLQLHQGAYLELDTAVGLTWGILTRIEYRDAFVALGSDRAYITKSWRVTAGARWLVSRWATVKAEYLHNGEYGRVPHVSNDVFTSSLVLSY